MASKIKTRKKRRTPEARPLSVDALGRQIVRLKGNVSAIAKSFKVSRQAVSAYVRSHPELAPLLLEARQGIVDEVESRFFKDCLTNHPNYQTSRIFFLKTQAKDRGYVERQETELMGPGGGPVVTEIVVEHHVAIEADAAQVEASALGGGRGEAPPEVPSGPAPRLGIAG